MNFGLIGCGRVAPRHAKYILAHPDANLVAVADVKENRAKKYAEDYHCDWYADYQALLERQDIDVVNIATWSGLHAQMSIDALRAGKHVIVEKPMALKVEDANEMIRVAKDQNRKLCVVLQNRYNPPMQDLKQAIDQHRIGKLLLGSVTVRWFRPQEYYEDDWHGTLSMDGGALMNQSIHHIDAMQWLMGAPVSVFADTDTLAHTMEAEDVGVGVVRFASGALGVIEGSTVTFPQNLEASIALFGQCGSLKVGGTALNRKEIWKIEGELEKETEIIRQEQLDPPSVYGYGHERVIADMVNAVRDDREPETNGFEGRKSVVMVLAMYESARTQKPVDLPQEYWQTP